MKSTADDQLGTAGSDYGESAGNEVYSMESSVDDSDLDDALFGITGDESNMQFTRKKRQKWKRATPYTQKVKRKLKRKTAATPSQMSAETKKLMQEVFDAYLGKDFARAVKLLEEIVRCSPGLHDPLHWLGLIYEKEYNDKKKATNYYFLAAHLVPKDAELWKQIGRMSQELGNVGQAIYCYRRCQRNSAGNLDPEVSFEFARCLMQRNEYKQAITLLAPLCHHFPDNAEFCLELSKCYRNTEHPHAPIRVFEDYMKAVMAVKGEVNLDCANMLCGLYLEVGDLESCRNLVKGIYADAPLHFYRQDLIIKLAVAEIQLGEYSTAVSIEPALWDVQPIPQSLYEHFVVLGTAYYNAGIVDEALRYYYAVFDGDTMKSGSSIWIKMANCHIQMNQLDAAAKILSMCLQSQSQVLNARKGKADTELRMKYCEVLSALGRIEEAEQILLSLSYEDLRGADSLPRPIRNDEREKQIRISQLEFEQLMKMDTLGAAEDNTNEMLIKKKVWVKNFFHLVEDSELDTQRILRHCYRERSEIHQAHKSSRHIPVAASTELGDPPQFLDPAFWDDEEEGKEGKEGKDGSSLFDLQGNPIPKRRRAASRVPSISKIKQKLGLLPLEDILGWSSYSEYLMNGVAIAKQVGFLKESVDMLEAVLSNKKQDRSNTVDNEKKLFKQRLESAALSLSAECGLVRVTLSHVRARYMLCPGDSNRVLQTFSNLLFTGCFAHQSIKAISASKEKDILLENRAWAIRQLLHHPLSFPLTLIVGHFCTISTRWPYAVAEYTRAHKLLPRDDLVNLCVATSYLNFSSSRSIQDRHAVILRGFAMLNRYLTMRNQTADEASFTKTRRNFFKAENLYNLARAFHQIGLFHLCIPQYLKCLQVLDGELGNSVHEATTMRQFGTSYCRSEDPSVMSDIKKLSMCAAYNLYIIWRSQKSKAQALWVSNKYLIWS